MFRELLRFAAQRTEGSVLLPVGTVRVRVSNKSKATARVAFESGLVAVDDGGEEVTSDLDYDSGRLGPQNRTLYFAADVAGTIIEVYPEHARDRATLGPGWDDGFSV